MDQNNSLARLTLGYVICTKYCEVGLAGYRLLRHLSTSFSYLILVLSFSDLHRKAAIASYNRRSNTKEFPLMYSWWNQCCIQAPYLPVVVHELSNSLAAAAVQLVVAKEKEDSERAAAPGAGVTGETT